MLVTVSHIAVSAVMSSQVVEGSHCLDVLEDLGSFCVPLILSSDPTSGVEQRHSVSCRSSGLRVRPWIHERILSLLILRMLEGFCGLQGP